MAVRVTLECGHTSVLRSRTTSEGYTHDWEVFLRGVDNADVHHYIEKVVFTLHNTFPKPKRVIKEPPYTVRESGYAGFVIPIQVYLKNKDEPKKFQISYDLHLQPCGPAINKVICHDEIIPNPSEEFRRKLLKGGATIVSSLESAPDKGEQQSTLPMIGKPKLSGSDGRKHRPPEPRTSNSFHDLFGEPIKTAKVSPDNKKTSCAEKGTNIKPTVATEKTEKLEKTSKVKHSPHKEGKKDKSGEEKKSDKKEKDHLKERERSKEKSKRSQSPATKISHSSPGIKRTSSPLPPKKPPSPLLPPPARRPVSPKPREKDGKKPSHERDKDKEKEREKDKSRLLTDGSAKGEKRKDKKKHKEDRDKEKKDKHKERDRDKSKENTKYNDKVDKPEMKQEKIEKVEKVDKQQAEKQEKVEKDKSQETVKVSKDGRKSPKPSKEMEKPKEDKVIKIEKPEKVDKIEKNKDAKGDNKEKQKHKHKKRDKKDRRDGSKEREKKEKKEKSKGGSEKQNNVTIAPPSNPLSTLLSEIPERDSSDSAPSPDDDTQSETKQISTKKESPPTPPPPPEPPRLTSPPPPVLKKEKTEKMKKEKSRGGRGEEKEGRKRKRRSSSKGDEEPAEKGPKRDKERARSPSLPLEPVSSSQSPVAMETESMQPPKGKDEEEDEESAKDGDCEAEQVAPDSTNNTLAEVETSDPPVFSEDYVSQLKDLQQKIMTLQDNQELQRVVQVIAETGQYEITKKTFDFDLCALDRRTVQRLQEFFSTS